MYPVLFQCVLCVAEASSGFGSDFIQQEWTKRQGLPDNQVNAVLQSADGYVWLATGGGLARLDGFRFTVFDRTTVTALSDDRILSIGEDELGRLWVGTPRGYWSPHGLSFSQFFASHPAQSNSVIALHSDRQETMWLGTADGVVRWKSAKSTRFLGMDSATQTRTAVTGLVNTQDGTLWASTDRGLYRLAPGGTEFVVSGPNEQTAASTAFALCLDTRQRVWVLLGSAGQSHLYCLEDGRWRAFADQMISNSGRAMFLFEDRVGNLWMPGEKGALLRFRNGRFERLELPGLAAQSYATCMAEDAEGGLWIGTESQGVTRLKARNIWTATAEDGLPSDKVWSICEDSNEVVWVGTESGLAQYADGRMASYVGQADFLKQGVRVVTTDGAGRVWFGNRNSFACLEAGVIRQFRFPGEWFNTKVNALWAGSQDTLWVGTVYGLRRVDTTSLPVQPDGESSICEITNAPIYTISHPSIPTDVRAVVEDPSGVVWCAIPRMGIARLQNGVLDLITTSNGLSSDIVWALHADAEGSIWIGTDRGLNRWRDGHIHVFSRREGLFTDSINQILEDDDGHLWIGSDHGIGRVRKSDLEAVAAGRVRTFHSSTYDEDDGLMTDETNGQHNHPSASKSRDGRIWFPTTKGVVAFDPLHLPDATNPPPVLLEQVRANGQLVYENASGPTGSVVIIESDSFPSSALAAFPNSKLGSPLSELRLAPGARILEIKYTASTFTSADKVRFNYRLDGLDKDWVDAGSRRTAYYANLRPGRYQFRVIGGNKYGVWNDTGTRMAIHLRPHFHETWWFYSLCAVVIGMAAFVFYRWRLRYVRRIHHLERDTALAHDRARIAKDLHDGLGGQLTQLTILAELSDRPGSGQTGFEERLRQLSRLARETALQLKEIVWTNHPGDETLDGLAARICQYAEQFLRPAGFRCRFHVPESLPPSLLSPGAWHHLFLVAKEALNNIAKHSAASEVRIEVSVSEAILYLTISDNGCGLSADRHLPSTHNPHPVSGGHGLRNMRERIEALGGKISIGYPPAGGTEIRLEVPLQKLVV